MAGQHTHDLHSLLSLHVLGVMVAGIGCGVQFGCSDQTAEHDSGALLGANR